MKYRLQSSRPWPLQWLGFLPRRALAVLATCCAAVAASAAISITPATIPNATVGTPYAQTLTATGGTAPYVWKLQSGGFPTGLSLTSSGQITGTPAAGGSWIYSYPFQIYITVKDSAGHTNAKSYTINVLPPTPTTYTLTVVNGSGSGTYSGNATVTISANAAPAGQVFQSWTGATVANALSATTTLVMPATNTTVTATYTAAPPPPPTQYSLTVVNGSGSGSYAAGANVAIAANAAPAGQVFQNWTGASVADAQSASTTLTMPAAAATVTANSAVDHLDEPSIGHGRHRLCANAHRNRRQTPVHVGAHLRRLPRRSFDR